MDVLSYILVVLYDGQCGFCNRLVRFLQRRINAHRFQFVTLQSSTGKKWLKNIGFPPNYKDSVVYIKNNRSYTKSEACLVILRDMGRLWSLSYSLMIVPKPARDCIYNF